ncbi:hypothetical protein Sru01_09000 [Sphaerisporangium rufum]|uniref:V-type ATPase, D subunit n=1 Tax=Sphaerisporangium rufum TaxID=1381558 RepID=A0A919QY03_9ACTN|nr:V-type ATP synthase subunit D [Sphaerisporangium rufum]GII75918.1 hypothetical protein Sru01_09000 [Sphaerisporangium rufum]
MRVHAPPGRAGHLWLRRRLATAEHALDLLDRRLALLQQEHDRLVRPAARTGRDWAAALADSETWTRRVARLGGERALRLGAPAGRAEVDIEPAGVLGVRCPGRVTCRFPAAPDLLPLTAALGPARAAAQAALAAAVRHAAAQEAVRLVAAEVHRTRRRVRALRERWIPALTAALADRALTLEEQDRADRLRRPSDR